MTTSGSYEVRSTTTRETATSSRIPELPFPPIPRPEIYSRLDATRRPRRPRVLLVCAPAGSGKTVLLADWVRRHVSRTLPRVRIAWHTAIDGVDDAATMWAELSAELGVTTVGRDGLSTPMAKAADLARALSTAKIPTVLVIDDAHLVTDQFALAGLEEFLHYAPPNVSVVISGRFDPPVRWHTLDLGESLIRIGAAELALDRAQTAMLCAQHGCELTDTELDALMDLTRGWAVLVRIAATYLAAHQHDRAAAIAGLARPSHAVTDFLVGELIAAVSESTCRFLRRTSVPASFTVELAQELAGPDATVALDDLERLSFPIDYTTDGENLWFGYHPLLRSYLLAEAERLDGDLMAELHLRSARWYCGAGRALAALPHLLIGPDRSHLLEFLRDTGPAIVLAGDGTALLNQITRDAPNISDDPFIWLLRAVNALIHGDMTDALAYLDLIGARYTEAESFVPGTWLRSLLLAVTADTAVTTGVTLGELVIPDQIPATGQPDIDCYTAIQTATAIVVRGDVVRGEEQLRSALALAEHVGHPRLSLRAITRLAIAAGISGTITSMRGRAERALEVAAEHGLYQSPDTGQAVAMAAMAAYLKGEEWDVEQVTDMLIGHLDRDGSTSPTAGWHSHVVGRLLACDASTDKYAATDALRSSMVELLEQHPVAATTGGLIPHVIWALLRVREHHTARLLVNLAQRALGDTNSDLILAQAALALDANKPRAARALVEPMLTDAGTLHPVTAITGWLLLAAEQDRDGSAVKTTRSLANALRIAAPDSLIRPFLDVPDGIRLLDSYAGRFGHDDAFADKIRNHPAAHHRTSQPTLTGTELTVLKQLPSGRTAQQIATDLGVSVNTVKTHLRGIYSKLGTNSRNNALTEARHIGLL
ncbi:LuxR C-terminal-related transcriptional regulator [Nocardia australiensis]|uniref:LuxR C-terminal-related transcriptional regulator n=1 Tax=Nocardia australiensis TaxID=2887191 RepID=UPI001D14F94E|nr:LuxR C-terminal-related transcriptional regulator [Nocardia australiensis]